MGAAPSKLGYLRQESYQAFHLLFLNLTYACLIIFFWENCEEQWFKALNCCHPWLVIDKCLFSKVLLRFQSGHLFIVLRYVVGGQLLDDRGSSIINHMCQNLSYFIFDNLVTLCFLSSSLVVWLSYQFVFFAREQGFDSICFFCFLTEINCCCRRFPQFLPKPYLNIRVSDNKQIHYYSIKLFKLFHCVNRIRIVIDWKFLSSG